MSFNKKIIVELIQKYYLKNDLSELTFSNKNKLVKFKKLNYKILDIFKFMNSIILSNDFLFSKTNTIVTVCKLIRNDKIVNYGFVYGNIDNKIVSNQLIVYSLSSISKDGEYKHRIANIDKLQSLFTHPIIIEIYDYLTNNFNNKEFDLDFSIYNLNKSNMYSNYKKLLLNKILLLKVYTLTWLTELYVKNKNNQLLNVEEVFFNTLATPKDIIFFKNIFDKNKLIITDFMNFIYYAEDTRLDLGQKLMPFNYTQLKNYGHLIHFQWKEMLINRIINNLIHNNISLSFSLFANWILISKSNKNLYNNTEIFKKIDYSDQIKNILNYLYLAKNNLLQINNVKLISKLEKKLHNIIEITQNNMLMSNVSLNFFSEYSGKTLFNHLNLILTGYNNKLLGDFTQDYNLFCKYIFDIIYSLYCLNLKGVIHGDLHLNNITMFLNSKVDTGSNVIYDLNSTFNNDIVNYINTYPNIYDTNKNNNFDSSDSSDNFNTDIGDLDNCFQFEHTGYFSCIIDYGRSFVLLKLIDENIIEKEKSTVRQTYIKNETKRIIAELNKIFPNFIKNNLHKLKFLLKNKNFNILFIYFTAYDTFTFITNLLIFLKKSSIIYKKNFNPKIIELLTKLSKKSYFYLEKILNEDNYSAKTTHQFPNYLLLNEFFSDFKSTTNNKKLDLNITHYFSIKNINRYYTINQIRTRNKKILNEYINHNDVTQDEINFVKKRFSKLLNFDSSNYTDLDVEKLINKEYYNIKSNVHILSSVKDNNLDLTYDVTTNSLNISNY